MPDTDFSLLLFLALKNLDHLFESILFIFSFQYFSELPFLFFIPIMILPYIYSQ